VSDATRAIRSTASNGDGLVVRPPAYQALADQLRDQIASGQVRPGERLPTEPQLCASFGLSRSTVREALRLLASQHLIITTRGVSGGSFVSEPRPEKLADSLATALRVLVSAATVGGAQFIEMRELLDVPGAALAAQRRTQDDLDAIRAALFDPDEPQAQVKLSAYCRFHAALTAAVHNPLFEMLARPLHQMTHDRQLALDGPAELWHRVAHDLRLLLGCLESGDSAGAAESTRRHLAFLRGVYQDGRARLADAR
jgi:DNA-binding FadR family transcriptional regulator